MLTIQRDASVLLVIDFQSRLMPAIKDGAAAVGNARRLLQAAEMLDVPALFTEQNTGGLGSTVPALAALAQGRIAQKMTFDACRAAGFIERLDGRRHIVVAGCETHVCVLQTALGLLDAGRCVYLVRDAVGSRRTENKEAAIRRLERHGAEILTTEMVIFEWLGSAEHPRFRDILGLVR
jgi:nicotinamidase-related amidase